MSIKRSSHARYDLWYHLVWATKYRKHILIGKIRDRVKDLLQTIALHHDCEIEILKILPDHVHLLISVPPRLSLARIVQYLKTYSAHRLFLEFPELKYTFWGGELWIGGYFVRSAGSGITKEAIQKYINEQATVEEP